MITSLTPEQIAAAPRWVETWKKIGLDVSDASEDELRAVVARLYTAGGYKPPRIMITLSSPAQCELFFLPEHKIPIALKPYLEKMRGELVRQLPSGIAPKPARKVASDLFHSWSSFTLQNFTIPVTMQMQALTNEPLNELLRAQLWEPVTEWLKAQLGGIMLKCHGTCLRGQADGYLVAEADYVRFIAPIYPPDYAAKLDAYIETAKTCHWIYPFSNLCLICRKPSIISLDKHERLKFVRYRDGWEAFPNPNPPQDV
ncbi:MAG: hypothetical protein WAO02_17290 [Verrucomicrobiia bacterium]